MCSSTPSVTSASATDHNLLQSMVGSICSRRLLLQTPFHKHHTAALAPSSPSAGLPNRSFDANIVALLAFLLVVVTCSLTLNFITRCALRCSGLLRSILVDGVPANAGAPKGWALKELPARTYSAGLNLAGADAECAICLSEFAGGELIRVLPGCGHGFHAKCIDRWLRSHLSCPTCRQSLFGACRRTASASACGEGQQHHAAPAQTIITPLQPEGLIINHRA